MEHCGDDFLAALAESMEDSEEWDDLQDAEMEASGNLETFLDGEDLIDGGRKASGNVHSVDDDNLPVAPNKRNFVELDSSSDSDSNLGVRRKKDAVSTPSSDWRSSFGFAWSPGSLVRTVISFIIVVYFFFVCAFNVSEFVIFMAFCAVSVNLCFK